MSKLWDDKLIQFCNEMLHYYIDKHLREHNITLSAARYEDVFQEAWIDLLKQRKNDPEGEITAGMIDAAAFHKIMDEVRRSMRHTHLDLDTLDHLEREEDPDVVGSLVKNKDQRSGDQIAQEWFDLIPITDPDYDLCRKWLEFYLEKLKIKSFGINPPRVNPDGSIANEDGYTRQALAKYLGFSGTGPSKYKRLNDKMKTLMQTYLGTK